MDGLVRSREVAEAARIDTDWGSLTWLASKELTDSEELTVGRVVIKKGMANPRHFHPNCEEILYLLRGRLEHSLGDNKALMKAGDTLVAPAGVAHNAISIGECDAEMIVVYSSGQRQFKKET